jgi:hypothetical protein
MVKLEMVSCSKIPYFSEAEARTAIRRGKKNWNQYPYRCVINPIHWHTSSKARKVIKKKIKRLRRYLSTKKFA